MQLNQGASRTTTVRWRLYCSTMFTLLLMLLQECAKPVLATWGPWMFQGPVHGHQNFFQNPVNHPFGNRGWHHFPHVHQSFLYSRDPGLNYPQQPSYHHPAEIHPNNDTATNWQVPVFTDDKMPDKTIQDHLKGRTGKLMGNVSASFRIAGGMDVDGDLLPGLMLYPAPPSYENRMQKQPEILVSARPLPSSFTTNRIFDYLSPIDSPSIPGVVKLSPSIQTIASSPSPWASAVTLKVSLRPEIWTKSNNKPRVTDEMRQFLPELKYYKKGLKPIDLSKVKTKVEKFVFVKQKKTPHQEQKDDEIPPNYSILNDDVIVLKRPSDDAFPIPMARDQELSGKSKKPIKDFNSWATDLNIPVSSHEKLTKKKKPAKSIKDIMFEIMATTNSPIETDEQTEKSMSSDHEKELSDLFDLIYVRNGNGTQPELSLNESGHFEAIKQIQDSSGEKLSDLDSIILRLIGQPKNGHQLPVEELRNKLNDTENNPVENILLDLLRLTTQNNSVDHSGSQVQEENSNDEQQPETTRCQGLWCFHTMPPSVTSTQTEVPMMPIRRPVRPQVLRPKAIPMATDPEKLNMADRTTTKPAVERTTPLIEWEFSQTMRYADQSSSSSKDEEIQKVPTTIWDKRVSSSVAGPNHFFMEISHAPPEPDVLLDTNSSSSNTSVILNPGMFMSPPATEYSNDDDESLRASRQHLDTNLDEMNATLSIDDNHDDDKQTKVNTQQLEMMFSGLGHGIGQVMGIVSPLAVMKNPEVFEKSDTR